MVRRIPVLAVTLGACFLAGCQAPLTLEEAQRQCAAKGGQLVIFYTQKITLSGVGPVVQTPGDCIMPEKFGVPTPKPAAPAGTPAPAQPAAPPG
jgi:hypothetical protein